MTQSFIICDLLSGDTVQYTTILSHFPAWYHTTSDLREWICSHDTGHMWEEISPHLSQRLDIQGNQS